MVSMSTPQIVDDKNGKIAVEIPIDDFEKKEFLLEDHALFSLMKDNSVDDLMELTDAQEYYNQLVKLKQA